LPGGSHATSKDAVAVALSSDKADRPVVALVAPDKPIRVLSKPAANGAAAAAVVIHAVETEAPGKLYVSGRAEPRGTVRLYLNEAYLASATASADGRVAFAIASGVAPGDYRIRLDEVDAASGKVKSRSEVPFNVPVSISTQSRPLPATSPTAAPVDMTANSGASRLTEQPPLVPIGDDARPALAATGESQPDVVVVPAVETTIVSRGDNLWRISRATYGNGMRYSAIYRANQDQIRDPNRIYPGQVFVLPKHVP
jgi:nucleoid-associated protein YgaU